MTHALSYLDSLDSAPVSATATLTELRARLNRPLTDSGTDAARVIDELANDVDGGLIGSAGGRFFASDEAGLTYDMLGQVDRRRAARPVASCRKDAR